MTRIEAKDKIKKLLNLAKDRGATTNEAKVALNKAKALADKYEIAIRFADGSIYGSSKVETKQEVNKQEANTYTVMFTTKHWNKYLVQVVAKLFNLNYFVDNKNHVMYIKGVSREKFNYIKTFYENAIRTQYEDLQYIKSISINWTRKSSIRYSKEWYEYILIYFNGNLSDVDKKRIDSEFLFVPGFVEARRNKIEKYAKEV